MWSSESNEDEENMHRNGRCMTSPRGTRRGLPFPPLTETDFLKWPTPLYVITKAIFEGSKRKRSPHANGMHRDGEHRRGGPGGSGRASGKGASPPVAEKEGASRMERAGTGSGAHTFDARPCLNPRSLSRHSAIIVRRELLDIVTCSSSWKKREECPVA